MKLKPTQRGFLHGEFVDKYGAKCSIQESSAAMYYAIWFGIDDADPKIMVSDGIKMGLPGADSREGEQRNGWMTYPVPDAVSLNTRMHLTQEMVQDLLPTLQAFAETGRLIPTDPYATWKEKYPDAKIERGMIATVSNERSPEVYFTKEFLAYAKTNMYAHRVIQMFEAAIPPQDIIEVLCETLKLSLDKMNELRTFQPPAPMVINMDWNTAPDWVKEKFMNSKTDKP